MKNFPLLFVLIVFFASCGNLSKNEKADSKSDIVFLKEAFTTQRDTSDNVDSPAVWHGPEEQNWILATAKEGNVVIVYEATNGNKITSFGELGEGIGQLSRPNGIAVIDSIALVVERDNHRVQVFYLPSFEPIGFFGDSVLKRPYGITVDWSESGYDVYITDNYEMEDESIPPSDSLGQRVVHFQFNLTDSGLVSNHIKSFGDTSGDGVLYKVESILMDRIYNRLLIADELENQRNVKIYNFKGEYTGKTISNKYFQFEPEGIAIYSCAADSSGYYIITDQDRKTNTFQVFNRKTLEYIGGFSGEITRNTDGVALTQKDFGSFTQGAFYPVHDDGSLTAISWEDIAKTLGLRFDCD